MVRTPSTLLIKEHPLVVAPTLAAMLGIDEAIILQQVQYWLNINEEGQKDDHFIDGRWWCWNTAKKWQKQFPWMSIATINRAISKLEKLGMLISAQHFASKLNRTKWYTIDYKALEELFTVFTNTPKRDFIKMIKSILSNRPNDLYTENTFRYSLTDAQLARAQSPDREHTHPPKANGAPSDQEQNSDHDQYGHKRKTRNSGKSEKPGTSGLRNRTAIAQKDFSELEESVPVPELVETTTPSSAVLDRDTSVPRIPPKKKTKGEIKYGEDGSGWLQLPRGAKYARARKIACRWGQEALIERYDCTEWVEEPDGWYVLSKGDLIPLEEALVPDGVFGLAAIRNYVEAQHNLAQEDFNDDLKEAFESAIALCEKWGDRVFDLFSEWVVWRECAEDELGLKIFQRSLSYW